MWYFNCFNNHALKWNEILFIYRRRCDLKTREEFVDQIKEIRAMLASGAEKHCSCPNIHCEFYGDCYTCIRIHRHYKDHVPRCLQPMLREKMRGLIQAVEYSVENIPGSPKEYWDYLKETASPEGAEEV